MPNEAPIKGGECRGERGPGPGPDKTVPAAAARVQLNAINLSVTRGAKRRRGASSWGTKLVAHLMEKKEEISMRSLAASRATLCVHFRALHVIAIDIYERRP